MKSAAFSPPSDIEISDLNPEAHHGNFCTQRTDIQVFQSRTSVVVCLLGVLLTAFPSMHRKWHFRIPIKVVGFRDAHLSSLVLLYWTHIRPVPMVAQSVSAERLQVAEPKRCQFSNQTQTDSPNLEWLWVTGEKYDSQFGLDAIVACIGSSTHWAYLLVWCMQLIQRNMPHFGDSLWLKTSC